MNPPIASPHNLLHAGHFLLTPHHALFLDFDGTLVELADHPDRVPVPEGLRQLLATLSRQLGGALAIVTGRQLESLDERLLPLVLPGAGLHGAQLRSDADSPIRQPEPLPGVASALLKHFAGDAAIWIEDKGAAVAVHYRLAPERATEVGDAMAMAVVGMARVEVIAGKCVFEARAAGSGKNVGIRMLMCELPFQGRVPVFVGDDRTDEDGIREVQRLGGIGIRVGNGESQAKVRLADPSAVLAWLRLSSESMSGEGD